MKQLKYSQLNYIPYNNTKYVCINSTTTPALITVQLPLLARSEGVQLSWTQVNGFYMNEEIWQLDNVALLYNNEINSPLLSTFSRSEQSSTVLFNSGGKVKVCNGIIVMLDMVCTYLN